MIYTKVSGSIKAVPDVFYKKDGVWTVIDTTDDKVSGTWQRVHTAPRALYQAGFQPPTVVATEVIEYLRMSTPGSTSDFGNVYRANVNMSAASSETRAVFIGGLYSSVLNVTDDTIQYCTIASAGNTSDFGNISIGGLDCTASVSSTTKGVFAGGRFNSSVAVATNSINYITFASTGNSSNFGYYSKYLANSIGAMSPTIGLFIGGLAGTTSGAPPTSYPTSATINIEYITLATNGFSEAFGTMSYERDFGAAVSSNTRAVIGGGIYADAGVSLEYTTISTSGTCSNFGNLTVARYAGAAASSKVIGLFFAGVHFSGSTRTIDYVNTATLGSASNFGNTTRSGEGSSATSSQHGGIF